MQVITKEDFQSIKPEKPTPVKQEVPPPPPPPQNVQKTGWFSTQNRKGRNLLQFVLT